MIQDLTPIRIAYIDGQHRAAAVSLLVDGYLPYEVFPLVDNPCNVLDKNSQAWAKSKYQLFFDSNFQEGTLDKCKEIGEAIETKRDQAFDIAWTDLFVKVHEYAWRKYKKGDYKLIEDGQLSSTLYLVDGDPFWVHYKSMVEDLCMFMLKQHVLGTKIWKLYCIYKGERPKDSFYQQIQGNLRNMLAKPSHFDLRNNMGWAKIKSDNLTAELRRVANIPLTMFRFVDGFATYGKFFKFRWAKVSQIETTRMVDFHNIQWIDRYIGVIPNRIAEWFVRRNMWGWVTRGESGGKRKPKNISNMGVKLKKGTCIMKFIVMKDLMDSFVHFGPNPYIVPSLFNGDFVKFLDENRDEWEEDGLFAFITLFYESWLGTYIDERGNVLMALDGQKRILDNIQRPTPMTGDGPGVANPTVNSFLNEHYSFFNFIGKVQKGEISIPFEMYHQLPSPKNRNVKGKKEANVTTASPPAAAAAVTVATTNSPMEVEEKGMLFQNRVLDSVSEILF